MVAGKIPGVGAIANAVLDGIYEYEGEYGTAAAFAGASDDIDETLLRLRKHGAQLVGEIVRYQDSYRLCYIRGPDGLLMGLVQELNRARCAQATDKNSTYEGDR